MSTTTLAQTPITEAEVILAVNNFNTNPAFAPFWEVSCGILNADILSCEFTPLPLGRVIGEDQRARAEADANAGLVGAGLTLTASCQLTPLVETVFEVVLAETAPAPADPQLTVTCAFTETGAFEYVAPPEDETEDETEDDSAEDEVQSFTTESVGTPPALIRSGGTTMSIMGGVMVVILMAAIIYDAFRISKN